MHLSAAGRMTSLEAQIQQVCLTVRLGVGFCHLSLQSAADAWPLVVLTRPTAAARSDCLYRALSGHAFQICPYGTCLFYLPNSKEMQQALKQKLMLKATVIEGRQPLQVRPRVAPGW